jgi:Spy/CpxP family protein refolding chaperone
MKPIARDLRLVAIVALVSFAVCWGSNHWIFSHPIHDKDADEWLEEQLDLTPQQNKALEEVERKYEARRQQLHSTIHAASIELAEAILADGKYSKRVAAANAKIHAAQGELKQATLEHFFDMQPMLTETQRIKMNRIAADALYHNH